MQNGGSLLLEFAFVWFVWFGGLSVPLFTGYFVEHMTSQNYIELFTIFSTFLLYDFLLSYMDVFFNLGCGEAHMCTRVYRGILEDNLGCQSSPSPVFDTSCLVTCCVLQARWPVSFWEFSCLHLPFHIGILKLYTHTTMSGFVWVLNSGSHTCTSPFTYWAISPAS